MVAVVTETSDLILVLFQIVILTAQSEIWLQLNGPYSRSRFKVRPGLNPTFKPGLALNRIPEASLS